MVRGTPIRDLRAARVQAGGIVDGGFAPPRVLGKEGARDAPGSTRPGPPCSPRRGGPDLCPGSGLRAEVGEAPVALDWRPNAWEDDRRGALGESNEAAVWKSGVVSGRRYVSKRSGHRSGGRVERRVIRSRRNADRVACRGAR